MTNTVDDARLPELPESDFSVELTGVWNGLPRSGHADAYSAEQMRAYARATLTAAGAGGEADEDARIAAAFRDLASRDYGNCYASLFIAHMKEKSGAWNTRPAPDMAALVDAVREIGELCRTYALASHEGDRGAIVSHAFLTVARKADEAALASPGAAA